MKISGILTRLFLVAISGTLFIYHLLKNADKESLFDNFENGFMALPFVIAVGWALYKDFKTYSLSRNFYSFASTLTGAIFISTFFIIKIRLAGRDNSPVIIHAGYDGGSNGAWFEFRKDGTYKFANFSGIGIDYFRGDYIITDNVITLGKDYKQNGLQTQFLVFREKIIQGTTETVLYQIDAKQNIVDSQTFFIVHKLDTIK